MNVMKFYRMLPDRVQVATIRVSQAPVPPLGVPSPTQAEVAMARLGFTRRKPKVLRNAERVTD